MKALFNKLFLLKEFSEGLLIRICFLFVCIFILGLYYAVNSDFIIFTKILYFFQFFIVAYLIIICLINKSLIFRSISNKKYWILIILLLYIINNSYNFSEYAIEGGHDQGTYLESGINLSKTGSFNINVDNYPFVHTFPGWNILNQETVRHNFLPGNAIFLSLFYSYFNFLGIKVANSFLLLISSCLIFIFIKKITNLKTGIIWLILFLINYYTLHFTRAPYVENLQLFFTWFYLFLFAKGYIEKKYEFIALALIPLVLLLTIRLEGFLFIPFYIILSSFLFIKKSEYKKKINFVYLGLSISVSIFILFNLFKFDNNFLDPAFKFLKSNEIVSKNEIIKEIPYNQQIFIFLTEYYMFTPFIILMLILSIITILKTPKETQKIILIISFLIIPQFALLVRPGIAFYLPWFMRRHWAIFLPFAYMLISIFINNHIFSKSYINKYFKLLLILGIIYFFLIPGESILFLKQGAGIYDFENSLSRNFNKDDLVIFWDKYRYENFGPPLYFLNNTNVVYDRIPEHSNNLYALLFSKYKNVYIATSVDNNSDFKHPLFDRNLEFIKSIKSPEYYYLGSSCEVRRYVVNPSEFISYNQISKECIENNPPILRYKENINLNIYKLNNNFKDDFVNNNFDQNYKYENEITK